MTTEQSAAKQKKLKKQKSNVKDDSQRSPTTQSKDAKRMEARKAEAVRKRARDLESKFGTSGSTDGGGAKNESKRPPRPNGNKQAVGGTAKQRKRALESKYGTSKGSSADFGEQSIYITDFDNYKPPSDSEDSLSLTELKQASKQQRTKTAGKKKKSKSMPPAMTVPQTIGGNAPNRRDAMQKKKSGTVAKSTRKNKSKSKNGGFDQHQSYSSKMSADTYPSTNSSSRQNNKGRLSPRPSATNNKKKQRGRSKSMDRSVASMDAAPVGTGAMKKKRKNQRGRSMDRSVASFGGPPGPSGRRGRSMDRSVASVDNSFGFANNNEPNRRMHRSRSRGNFGDDRSQFGGPSRRGRSRDPSMNRSLSSFGHPSAMGGRDRSGFKRSRSMDHGMMASRSDFNMSGINFNPPTMSRQPSRFHMSGHQLQATRSFHGPQFADSRSHHGGRSVASVPSFGPGMMGKSTMSGFGPEQSRYGGPPSVHGPPRPVRPRRMRYLRYRREDIKTPPKSLVIIWVVVSAEMILDLVTTIISFIALVEDSECCGETIDLGPWPLAVTIPFFVLIIIELCFLARAIKITLCPDLHRPPKSRSANWFCRCLQWNGKTIFKFINFLVLVNPFFGSVVAWILLYQSSKNECFVVLGLEAASLLLHFISIWLEGDEQTICSLIFHCVPVLPFFVSVIVILIYLNQGGVCYLVEESLFWYSGCQLCPNGSPPTPDGLCLVGSDTSNATFVEATNDMLTFGQFCSETENFCFFEY